MKRKRPKPKRDWAIEFRWLSVDDWKKHKFMHDDEFTLAWKESGKFETKESALYNIRNSKPGTYIDLVSGREFRIKNLITGDVYGTDGHRGRRS